jgi:hypothetical protein
VISPPDLLRRHATRLVAATVVLALLGFSQLPDLSNTERDTLAARFKFAASPLPELAGQSHRSVREVQPSLERISAWVSSVGASVALNDLDRDGLPNDLCYVDTRTNQVIIAPAPGTPARYEPFALHPSPAPYDAATTAPMGCLPGDMNEDGFPDILVYYWGRTPIAYLRQNTGGTSALPLAPGNYLPREVVAGRERWYTNAATFADLDGDGHADLVIGNYFRDGAQILNAGATGREQMQHSMSRAFNAGRNRLLLWSGSKTGANPNVEFKEAEGALDDETAHGWTLALGAADLDGDLLPEIYFANDFGPDRLLHNRSQPGKLHFVRLSGVKGFTTPNSKVLGRDSFKGMGVDFGDLNGDGLLDIYVSNIADEYALEESHFVWVSTGELDRMQQGIAPYIDRSEPLGLSRSGWGWDARLADFDNDGTLEAIQATGFVKGEVNRWPQLHELAMGNDELLSNPRLWPRFQPGDGLSGRSHTPFFVRSNSGRYYDIAGAVGLDTPQVSRGIAVADVDGDGRQDYAVANQWEASYLYHNESPSAGKFLGLHLLLRLPLREAATTTVRPGHPDADTPGRPAIGASATVHLPDGRRLVAQVDGGNGHSGKRSPDLHFGLGQIPGDQPLKVDLQWRSTDGRVHHETLRLLPGWQTVLLDGGKAGGN